MNKADGQDAGAAGRGVPRGYKQTEVGVIPEDWNTPLLDAIAKRGSGHTPDKSHPEYWNGQIKWVSLQDSARLDQLYISDTAATITPAGIANSSATMHAAGTVVLSRDAGVGKSAIMQESMAVSQHFMAWACSSKLNNHFLYYWLQRCKPELERIAMGNTIKTIGLPYFKQFRIPLPQRPEQDGIAVALSDADALTESLAQLLAKKRDLKQGVMQELLTGRRRLQGFDGPWRQIQLGDCADVLTGFPFPSAGYVESGVRLLRGSNIKRGITDWSDGLCQYWPSLSSDISKYQLQKGDIVVAMDGSLVGRSFAQISEGDLPCILLQRVARIRSRSEKFAIEYLKEWVCSEVFTIHCDSLKTVTAIPHISRDDIQRFVVQIPCDPHEQSTIATILSDMDTEITTLESKLTKARHLKQGMMQALLTGRIRLI